MGEANKLGHLKLVADPPARLAPQDRKPTQGLLFPDTAGALLCLVNMPALSDELFENTVTAVQPALVFDLRALPSFNIGRLSRHLAFEMFEGVGSRYVDVPGLVGAVSRGDTKTKADAMVDVILGVMQQAGAMASRVMFLMDDPEALAAGVVDLPQVLPARGKDPWQVRVVGGVRAS